MAAGGHALLGEIQMRRQCEAKARAATQMNAEGVTKLYRKLGKEVTPNQEEPGWRRTRPWAESASATRDRRKG